MNRLLLVAALVALSGCSLDFLNALSGAECSGDADCHGGKVCADGACVECQSDGDCDRGHVCTDGECIIGHAGEGEGEGGLPGGEGEGEGEGGLPGGEGEGEGEGEGDVGCGSVTTQGDCVGNTLEICISGALQTADCSDTSLGFPAGTQCEEINPNYGFDCANPAGSPCLFQDPNDTTNVIQVPCQGSQPGCRATDDTSAPTTCEPAAGFTCDGSVFATPVCHGDDFVFGCVGILSVSDAGGQPLYADCAALGGTCDTSDATNKGCFVATAGAACIQGVSFCGSDPASATACPTTNVCP